MNNWTRYFTLSCFLVFSLGCASQPKGEPTAEFVKTFKGWPAKRQAGYFNGLAEKARLDLLVATMRAGGEFYLPPTHEVKFLSDGEFIYDRFINGQGYVSGDQGSPLFRTIRGHWKYENGKITLEGDPRAIPFLTEGYTWLGARAEILHDKEIVFDMKLVTKNSPDAEEEALFMVDRLNSPAIRSYADKINRPVK